MKCSWAAVAHGETPKTFAGRQGAGGGGEGKLASDLKSFSVSRFRVLISAICVSGEGLPSRWASMFARVAFLSSTLRSCNCFWSSWSCNFNRLEASQKSPVYFLRSDSFNLRTLAQLTRFPRMWPFDVANWYASLSVELKTTKGPSQKSSTGHPLGQSLKYVASSTWHPTIGSLSLAFLRLQCPLVTNLMKGSPVKGTTVSWEEKEKAAFQELKTALTSAPVLRHQIGKPFTIDPDSSQYTIRAVLQQFFPDPKTGKDQLHPIAYESKKLTETESRYPTQEQELLAAKYALDHWRHIIEGSEIIIRTDHQSLQTYRDERITQNDFLNIKRESYRSIYLAPRVPRTLALSAKPRRQAVPRLWDTCITPTSQAVALATTKTEMRSKNFSLQTQSIMKSLYSHCFPASHRPEAWFPQRPNRPRWLCSHWRCSCSSQCPVANPCNDHTSFWLYRPSTCRWSSPSFCHPIPALVVEYSTSFWHIAPALAAENLQASVPTWRKCHQLLLSLRTWRCPFDFRLSLALTPGV